MKRERERRRRKKLYIYIIMLTFCSTEAINLSEKNIGSDPQNVKICIWKFDNLIHE